MSAQYANPLIRRGPNHIPYLKLKSISHIRAYLIHLGNKPRTKKAFSTPHISIPKSLYDVRTFKKLIMMWEVAKSQLDAIFIHNTTCIDCSSAPWKGMVWRHNNSHRVNNLLKNLKDDMEDFSIWKDM